MSLSTLTSRAGLAALRLAALLLVSGLLSAAGSCEDNLGTSGPGPRSFRISIATNTVAANGASASPSFTTDGNLVCFASRANNLASPSSGFQEIFVRDRLLDKNRNFTQLSLLTAPSFGGDCVEPYMSSDGKFIVFGSKGGLALDPVNNPALTFPTVTQLYLLITTNAPPTITQLTDLNMDCTDPSVSDDGRFVAFRSQANNVPGVPNSTSQPMVWVLDTSLITSAPINTVTLISHSTGGATTICNRDAEFPRISRDGSTVVFQSQATDLTADPNPNGHFDNVPARRIYSAAADGTGVDLVSRATDSGGPRAPLANHSGFASVSADGRYVAFNYQGSSVGETAIPGASQFSVVRRDRLNDVTELVATDGFILALFVSYGAAASTSISDDGRFVSYTGVNPAQSDLQVRVRDMLGGAQGASNHIIDPGAQFNNELPRSVLCGDGRWVAWQSISVIEVVGDSNGVQDVFGYGPIY